MPLPGTARFGRTDQEGALTEFDSPAFVVAFHQENQRVREGEATKRNLTLRVGPRELARLTWLARQLDVPKTALARELLGAALVEGLDALNITEDSKADVEAEIDAIEREIMGEAS